MFEIKGKYTSARILIDDVEQECVSQITKMINHPVFTENVVIMPDTHAGKGSVIGFTMPLTDLIIPNVIGVDIGCGMLCAPIGKNLNQSIEKIDRKIQQSIPMGVNTNRMMVSEDIDFEQVNKIGSAFIRILNDKLGVSYSFHEYNQQWLNKKINQIGIGKERFSLSIGSLGGGNHFIEIGQSEDAYYVTIHSGSRNFGLKVAEFWQKRAISYQEEIPRKQRKEEIEEIKRQFKNKKEWKNRINELKFSKNQPSIRELASLSGEDMIEYFHDMVFAQFYASFNRKTMMKMILEILNVDISGETVESVHNYIDFKDLVIRKGAIRSYEGEKMIIPFNMRDGILICEGKSNAEWNCSAPHGAGRLMSRTAAKKSLKMEDYKRSMKDVYSTCVSKSTIDESPMAYKDSKTIEKLIQPTATILKRLKPVLNIKAPD